MKLLKTIKLLTDYDIEALPTTAEGLIRALQFHVDKVPEEFKSKVAIGYEMGQCYGDNYCHLSMWYQRVETDEEYVIRLYDQQNREKIEKEHKLTQFNKLKQELGL